MKKPPHFIDVCDIDGVRPVSWVCSACGGHCCGDCVTFQPAAELNELGRILCFRCDGVVGGIGHQQRLAAEVHHVA